jgi:DNA replication and repair protein RecF
LAVRRLRLTQFRNYAALDLDLEAGPVLLFGENGAGKTNLLEAVSLLTAGRGLRGAAPDQLARREGENRAPAWGVWAEIDTPSGDHQAATGGQGSGRREMRLDGEPASQATLGRLLPMIWLTPAQDRLFAGPRADRLRFFDRLVYAADPAHAEAASAYEKTRSQRQRLLDEGGADPSWLSAVEAEMAGHGVAMAAARLEALIRLQASIDALPDDEGGFPSADLALEGAVEADLAEQGDAAGAEDRFIQALREGRGRDAAAGRTLVRGPHRTELQARHRAKDQAAADCSTGEQKALVLGLALAQARVLADRGGAPPLLLLDEACAHLDASRREGLARLLEASGGQAWLTGVEAGLFSAFGEEAQRFEAEAGAVTRV